MSQSLLVVDDNDDICWLLQLALESQGYQVDKTCDSLTILSDIEQIRPRMLLIDIMMPGINGMEVTKQIRKKLQFQDLPILLVSANHYVTSAQAKQSGADDILYKPFNLDDLLSRVEMLLSQSTQKSAKMSEKKSQKNDNSYFQLLKSH